MAENRNPWPVLLVTVLGFFMIMLDTTIVYVATPSILSSLHASLDEVLWVFNGYLLTYAVLLITAVNYLAVELNARQDVEWRAAVVGFDLPQPAVRDQHVELRLQPGAAALQPPVLADRRLGQRAARTDRE